MNRDMELIRSIVLAIREHESRPSSSEIEESINSGRDDALAHDLFGYHMQLLWQSELVTGIDMRARRDPFAFSNLSLTWEGQDFADSVASEGVWSKVKSVLSDQGIKSAAFSVVADLAKDQLKKNLGMPN